MVFAGAWRPKLDKLQQNIDDEQEVIDNLKKIKTPSPFEAIQQAASPFVFWEKFSASRLSYPFTKDIQPEPMAQPEPSGWIPRTDTQMQKYEQWEAPQGVKGSLELAAGFAVSGPMPNPVKGVQAGVKVAQIVPSAIKVIMPDLQDFDEVVKIANRPDVVRKIANLPVINSIARNIAGKAATARTPAEWAVVGLGALKEEAKTKASAVFAPLQRLGISTKVFDLAEDGTIKAGKLKGVHLNTIRTYPQKYLADLSETQETWVRQAGQIEKVKTEFLKRNGIKITELTFDEGGEYAGRRVFGKVDPAGNLLETAYVKTGGRPGAKMPFEKMRVYDTAEEAVKDGFRYLPEDEALYYNVVAAYNRVAGKKMADWLLEKIPYRSAEVFSIPKANQLVNDALKKLPIKPSRIIALKRDMPELSDMIESALAETSWETRYESLKQIKQYIKNLVPTQEAKVYWAVEKLANNRRMAQEAVSVLQRVRRGERLPTGTIKAIGKIIPEIKDSLTKASRLTLDDLMRSGEEAIEYPKSLPAPPPGVIKKYQKQISELIEKAKLEPNNPELLKEISKLKQKIGFSKYRIKVQMETGKPMEFSKSPVSILKGEHYKAIDEMVTLLRGESYQAKTATGKAVTKYKGGLIRDFAAKENEARLLRQKIVERAKQVKFGEAVVNAPAFAGKILTGPEAQETAKLLSQEFSPQYIQALTQVNKVNAIGRFFVLAGDISPMTIQLLFLAGENPKVYGKAGVSFAKALFDPEFLANYYVKHQDTILKSRNLMLSGGGRTEFTEAMARGGFFRSKPLSVLGKGLEPFQRGFESALDVAGVELREAYDYLATNPQRAEQVETFINEFRGLFSSTRLGISAGQQQLETAAILAPKYNRAIAALLFDVFRGNVRGQLARQSLARGIGAVSAMTVAISLARGEDWDEIAEHFNPNSENFYTWDIAGQKVGPGTKVRSIVRLFAQTVKDPQAAFLPTGLNDIYYRNPGLRFVRSNLSPTLSTGLDLLVGENFIGDPSRDGLLSLSKTVVAENMLPVWIQSVLLEGGDLSGRTARGLAGFAGLRSYESKARDTTTIGRGIGKPSRSPRMPP